MPVIRITLAIVVLSAILGGGALALEFKDIVGKWCGLKSSSHLTYTFEPDKLTVEFKNGSPTQAFKISTYQYLNDSIRVFMLDQKDRTSSTRFFGPFTDGNMRQESPSGLRRPFHRC